MRISERMFFTARPTTSGTRDTEVTERNKFSIAVERTAMEKDSAAEAAAAKAHAKQL